jgi:hypothetical protein
MRRPSLYGAVAVLMVVAGAAGCRSGQGPGAAAPSAPAAAGDVRQLVGQARILRHRGHEKKVSLRGDDVRTLAGGCDVAVEVRQAALDQGTLKLALAHVGQPRGASQSRSRRRGCVPAREATLTLTRVGNDAALRSALAAVLPTPEEYLAAMGTRFDRAAAAPAAPVADSSGATNEERAAARQVTVWPVALLTVDAGVPVASKRVGRRESEVDFTGVVGADGRLYDVKITSPLVDEHVKQLQRAFALWRYQPARAGDKELPARITGRAVLRMY